MTESDPTSDEAVLWQRAARRLAEVDPEPPLTSARLDALVEALGARAPGQELRSWLRGERPTAAAAPPDDSKIIPFDPKRQRFQPVERFTRLAADSQGGRLELPERELESEGGRFRLKVTAEGGAVVLELQTLGFAADDFANRVVGLAADEGEGPVAVVALDDDADGSVRLPDTERLRRALLRPVVGSIEEI